MFVPRYRVKVNVSMGANLDGADTNHGPPTICCGLVTFHYSFSLTPDENVIKNDSADPNRQKRQRHIHQDIRRNKDIVSASDKRYVKCIG